MAATATAPALRGPPPSHNSPPTRAEKYRGATVADLDPPPALSVRSDTSISHAMLLAYERDYTHLTITHPRTRALVGYIAMPRLKAQLEAHTVRDDDPVSRAMQGFALARRERTYEVITLDTPLERLEAFFEGESDAGPGATLGAGNTDGVGDATMPQEFAIITDDERKFVLGVATRDDLAEFVRRRPSPSLGINMRR